MKLFYLKYFISVVFIFSSIIMCTPSDLRPLKMRTKMPSVSDLSEGKLWLKSAMEVTGWNKYLKTGLKKNMKKAIHFRVKEHWPSSFSRYMASPWEKNNQIINIGFELNSTEVEFSLNDNAVKQKIILSSPHPLGDILKDATVSTQFISVYRMAIDYLVQLSKANYIVGVGSSFVGAEEYKLVLVSNSGYLPVHSSNQYLIWINAKSFVPEFLQFTMRHELIPVFGTLAFKEYSKVNGLLLPKKIFQASDPTLKAITYSLELSRFTFN